MRRAHCSVQICLLWSNYRSYLDSLDMVSSGSKRSGSQVAMPPLVALALSNLGHVLSIARRMRRLTQEHLAQRIDTLFITVRRMMRVHEPGQTTPRARACVLSSHACTPMSDSATSPAAMESASTGICSARRARRARRRGRSTARLIQVMITNCLENEHLKFHITTLWVIKCPYSCYLMQAAS